MDAATLPTLNACLNAVATVLLVVGRVLIRRGRIDAHRRVMLSAVAVSSLFLVFYVTHKVMLGFSSVAFNVEGVAKLAYLTLLFTHLVLAMTGPAFAITLVVLGLRDRRARHRRIARVAWPIWMYVSITGVVIYLLLYPFNPAPV